MCSQLKYENIAKKHQFTNNMPHLLPHINIAITDTAQRMEQIEKRTDSPGHSSSA